MKKTRKLFNNEYIKNPKTSQDVKNEYVKIILIFFGYYSTISKIIIYIIWIGNFYFLLFLSKIICNVAVVHIIVISLLWLLVPIFI